MNPVSNFIFNFKNQIISFKNCIGIAARKKVAKIIFWNEIKFLRDRCMLMLMVRDIDCNFFFFFFFAKLQENLYVTNIQKEERERKRKSILKYIAI